MVRIADLIEYRRYRERLVERVVGIGLLNELRAYKPQEEASTRSRRTSGSA
ncbi:MAG: hypothetical protein JSU06_18565 [Actinobacteria bacterium]|nr:hypothetical protein [Actinomycetota bacterium]